MCLSLIVSVLITVQGCLLTPHPHRRTGSMENISDPEQVTKDVNMDATFGIEALRTIERDPATIKIDYDQLKLDGFRVDIKTQRRWGHLVREKPGGRASAIAPKPGTYHVGFMMYDNSKEERVAVYIENRLMGVAVADRNNNRTWLWWLREPYDFKGGELVELAGIGPEGKHGICNIMFLPRPPETRSLPYEVRYTQTAVRVNEPGRVMVSWTTTSPSVSRFEYGKDTSYGSVEKAGDSTLVHRAVLAGLEQGVDYHGRAVGLRPDGSEYFGPDITFRADPLVPPPTVEHLCRVPLTVRNPHATAVAGLPVTAGIPFPRGNLASADHVRLICDNTEVPVQIKPTATWLDGSIKWVLISFLADIPANEETVYSLEFGRNVRRKQNKTALSVDRGQNGVRINTGPISFLIDRHGEIADLRRESEKGITEGTRLIVEGGTCGTVIRSPDGTAYRTAMGEAEVTVEEAGPVRALIKTVCTSADGNGKRSFRIEKRIEAYAGSAFLRIHHTFVNTCPDDFTNIEEMIYHVPVRAVAWQAGQTDDKTIEINADTPVIRQRLDNEFILEGKATAEPHKQQAPCPGRLTGNLLSVQPVGPALGVRDAWQNYPKAFRISEKGLDIGLCPDFDAGLYDTFPFEKEGHQLYYYLLNGRYRFIKGMAKTHELLLCFEPEPARTAVCSAFQRPLLATAPPEWYCNSRAFYDVAPRDVKKFETYEKGIDHNLKRYVIRREKQHDYGLMNYGDWYGERGSNWGNIEYDTQHAFFLQYIRSGNPEAFFLGHATEIHNRDIDTIQWSENPDRIGFVYIHQMCHVGRYYDKKVPGKGGWYRAGGGVSHAWTEGYFDHYFLTGDRRSWDTGIAVTNYFTRSYFQEPYDFTSCRNPGWHLILNAATYAATGDPYYLNASRVIVDRVLETQDKVPVPLPPHQQQPGRTHQIGGWSRQMIPGHCRCVPRCRGNAGFMVAILLIGLKYYDDVVDDPRVKDAIIRGAYYLMDECYSADVKGFRYTSCPEMKYSPGGTPLKYEGIARAYRWTKDERFKKALLEGLPSGFGGCGYGKSFSAYYRCGPRLLADIADLFPIK